MGSLCQIVVIDQDPGTLTLFLVIELVPVAEMLDKFPVAVNVGVQMPESPEQGFFCLGGVAQVKFPQLGVDQDVEKQQTLLARLAGGITGGLPDHFPAALLSR